MVPLFAEDKPDLEDRFLPREGSPVGAPPEPAAPRPGLQVLFRCVRAGVEPVTDVAQMTGGRRYLSLVPTQLARQLAADPAELRGLDAVLVGCARLEASLRARAEAAGVRVLATYGMSETCGGCVYDGVPLDGVRVAVGGDGRVRVGGPVLFDGYAGDPALTAQVRRGGWFLTSDVGRVHPDGRLEVLGRLDDVVVSGGVNVPAAAVAARLREHPHIHEAEVVGVPDDEWGQVVVAVLVGDVPLEEVRDWVGDRHPRAWAPRRVVPLGSMPLLPNGKVDRLAVQGVAAGVPA